MTKTNPTPAENYEAEQKERIIKEWLEKTPCTPGTFRHKRMQKEMRRLSYDTLVTLLFSH